MNIFSWKYTNIYFFTMKIFYFHIPLNRAKQASPTQFIASLVAQIVESLPAMRETGV